MGASNKSSRKPKKTKRTTAARTRQPAARQPFETAPLETQDELTNRGFPVVGIGASAGGLAAFEAFFSAMPQDAPSGMAFVLVQHLAPDHKSILADLVKRYTAMQVRNVEDGMRVEPNCTYIIPPNRDMAFINGRLQLLEPTAQRGLRLPIDFFFRSLAQDQRERAICIVLSGTGSDGTLGVRAVKGEGGVVMAQTPESTEFDGMPRSAIATGLVDYVLEPAEMPSQLAAYVKHAFGVRVRSAPPPVPAAEDTLRKICVVLRGQTGHDFSQYKENTLARRVERRMAIHQIERPGEYLRYLRQHPPEVESLFRDLLIGVTSFFRDPDAFEALQAKVLPQLLADKPNHTPLRVWVCGCSTGEEAYSIAILIQEILEGERQNTKVQIFATDIDRQAVEQARGGVYPASIGADVTPDRLARFFTQDREMDTYRVNKALRDMLIFSEQDVIRDPPFSKLDLISCRNLLIYMNGDLQKRLLPLFHYSLLPGGALFLGNSETVGGFTSLFEVVDRTWKLFQRAADLPGGKRPALGDFARSPLAKAARAQQGQDSPGGVGRNNLRELTERALLSHYAQAGILINARGEGLHVYGRTGRYFELAPGDAGFNILSMARQGLKHALTTALHKAVTQHRPIRCPGLQVKTNGETTRVDLLVRPLEQESSEDPKDLYLVLLEEAKPDPAEQSRAAVPTAGPAGGPEHLRISTLEQDLRAKEEYLQTTLEEMETSNEELRSTNEEMQSVNEELQSTNEELETSKEELQSVNEELATVNAELQAKVIDLSRVNNDMNNLLAGTGVGTLFVDPQLNIARFTPAATQVINLITADIGRPVGHIVSNLAGYDRLVEDVQSVLDSLAPIEAEVQTKAGSWFLMRIRPYRTLENVIEGVVITFVNISDRKQVEQALQRTSDWLAGIQDGFFVCDREWRFEHIGPIDKQRFRRAGLDPDQMLGKVLWAQLPGFVQPPSEQTLRQAMAKSVPAKAEATLDGQTYQLRASPTAEGGVAVLWLEAGGFHKDGAGG
jgi:two-component system CheB/CheR fusion protein